MKIMIGSPVRNRGWVLRRYLDALLRQKVNNADIEFMFVLNDSVDDTEDILKEYNMNYVTHNLNDSSGSVRGEYSFNHLAEVRNRLLQEFLNSDADYLFSVDTDIIVPEGGLRRLIDSNKDIISMLIKNHPTLKAHNIMINSKHLQTIPKGIIQVDVTGAVYLIKRKVIESGVRYNYSINGEDVPFCKSAYEHGFSIFCDTSIRPIHVYSKEQELIVDY